MAEIGSYPKNLSFTLKKLHGSINKQRVKINADRSTYNSTQTIRFTLPRGSIVDFRSLVIYATGSTAGTGSTTSYIHFPRGGLHSLIENLTISVNNVTLSQIQAYNFLYNTLFDLEGGSIEQASKRCVSELYDPTIRWSQTTSAGDAVTNENAIIAKINHSGTDATSNDTNVNFCANNFLGFLNSLSCPCLHLDDIGDVVISIQLAPASACYYSTITTSTPTISNLEYTLSNVYLTIDKLTFTNSLYYQLKKDQLLSPEGLKVAFYDYWTIVGSSFTKSAGCAINASINSASLNQLIATFRRSDYQTIRPLLFYGGGSLVANNATNAITYDQFLANSKSYTNTSADTLVNVGIGDGFANSAYFQRAGNDFTGSAFSINSVNMDGYMKPPIETFNNMLQVMGYNNIDISTAGLRPDCKSIYHWLKYYFCDMLSLENIAQDSVMWVSGYDGQNGGIIINYNATFASTNGQTVYPYVFAQSTKVLTIRAGRNLELI